MKKIITSISVLAVVSVVFVGATMAFFNDTETSTGNTFTAGAIDLTVDSFGASRNGIGIQDSPWFAKDLTSEKFFDFSDVKPGDWFDRSISLHVDNNPAWACLMIKNRQNDEHDLIDPEKEAGDITPGDINGLGNGELGKNMHILGWFDTNGNGKLNEPQEESFVNSFFDVFTEIPLHDSTTNNGSLTPQIPIELLQLSICGGNSIVAPDGTVSCNGASMNDVAQTDSLKADIQLYVEQVRNNPNFRCSQIPVPSV